MHPLDRGRTTRDRRGRFHDLAARVRAHAGRPLEALVAALRHDLLRHVHGDLDDDAALVALEGLPAAQPSPDVHARATRPGQGPRPLG
ncbi:hypothetical protein [Streptomyces sp. NPDC040750]|uniref:hypothetical protein n=1 Tax=Streptomyces sp. NPDC040750 TaxID=3154491 RepID=UPI0033C33204